MNDCVCITSLNLPGHSMSSLEKETYTIYCKYCSHVLTDDLRSSLPQDRCVPGLILSGQLPRSVPSVSCLQSRLNNKTKASTGRYKRLVWWPDSQVVRTRTTQSRVPFQAGWTIAECHFIAILSICASCIHLHCDCLIKAKTKRENNVLWNSSVSWYNT